MNSGSYDRRAPSPASQIITLERMLEESEAAYQALQAENAKLKANASITVGDLTISNFCNDGVWVRWGDYEGMEVPKDYLEKVSKANLAEDF